MTSPSNPYLEQSQWERLIAAERALRLKGVRDGVRDLFEKFIADVEREGAPKPVARSLAEMIAECNFRYVNSDITEERFPLVGPIADVSDMLTVSQKDLGGGDMCTAQIEAAIDRLGYRRTTLAELLAYAKSKWNGNDIVVALGSPWVNPDGFRLVPYLYCGSAGRGLHLRRVSPKDHWYEGCLLLVVRK